MFQALLLSPVDTGMDKLEGVWPLLSQSSRSGPPTVTKYETKGTRTFQVVTVLNMKTQTRWWDSGLGLFQKERSGRPRQGDAAIGPGMTGQSQPGRQAFQVEGTAAGNELSPVQWLVELEGMGLSEGEWQEVRRNRRAVGTVTGEECGFEL